MSLAVHGSYVDDMLGEARERARGVEQRYIQKLKDEKVSCMPEHAVNILLKKVLYNIRQT